MLYNRGLIYGWMSVDLMDLSVFLSHRNMNTVYETICERFTELVCLYCATYHTNVRGFYFIFP